MVLLWLVSYLLFLTAGTGAHHSKRMNLRKWIGQPIPAHVNGSEWRYFHCVERLRVQIWISPFHQSVRPKISYRALGRSFELYYTCIFWFCRRKTAILVHYSSPKDRAWVHDLFGASIHQLVIGGGKAERLRAGVGVQINWFILS